MSFRGFRLALCALALLALSLTTGCDKATPVAPNGTILVVTANPSKIGLNGTSTITVVGRKPDGQPLNPGTEIRFSTDKGSIDPIATIHDGTATATLRGDGRSGTAKVTASTGNATTMGTVDVQIGVAAGGVTLQASPSTVPVADVTSAGFPVSLLALVRDDQGQPLADALVNFGTDIGVLASGGAFKRTDASGQARDTLTLRPADLSSLPPGTTSFQVRVQASGAGGATSQGTFDVRIQRDAPVASFNVQNAGGNKVHFVNTTTGLQPITYAWFFNNGTGTPDSTDTNPTFDYGSPGSFTVRLEATNSEGSSTAFKTFTVPVQ